MKIYPFFAIVLLAFGALGACANAPASHAPDVVLPAPDAAPTAEASSRTEAPTADASSGRPVVPLDRSRVDSARAQARALATAVKIWQANQGDVCPRHEDLVRDHAVSLDSDGLDPWGHAFRIACSDTGVTITSSGPDEKPGTADDVGDQ